MTGHCRQRFSKDWDSMWYAVPPAEEAHKLWMPWPNTFGRDIMPPLPWTVHEVREENPSEGRSSCPAEPEHGSCLWAAGRRPECFWKKAGIATGWFRHSHGLHSSRVPRFRFLPTLIERVLHPTSSVFDRISNRPILRQNAYWRLRFKYYKITPVQNSI